MDTRESADRNTVAVIDDVLRRAQRLADAGRSGRSTLTWHVQAAYVGDLTAIAAARVASG